MMTLNRSKDSISKRAKKLELSKLPSWSPEQDRYLRAFYANTPNLVLAKKLNHPIFSVQHRARKFGLYKPDIWTAEQIEFLKNNYATLPMNELKKSLNKTENTIYGKVKKLRLAKQRRTYPFQKEKEKLYYLAGIIDGEGSIEIRKPMNSEHSVYCLRVRVSNTNFELIEWLKTNFGGKTSFTKKIGNRRPQKTWAILAYKASVVLKEIMPLLIVKKQQAKVALLFQQGIAWPFKGGKNGVPIEESQRRHLLYEQMKVLNKRGNSKS